MPLVLALHTIESAPSATVPFAVILLQDSITNRDKIPAGLKCRQLVPSSGATSISLWDVSDAAALQQWLDEAINVDVTHTVYEVQEEFAIGLGEVVRARAAEKVTEGTKEVAQKTGRALNAAASSVGQQAIEIDHRLRLSERATAAGTAIKESAVGRSAGAAFGRIGSAVGAGTKKVLENEKVAGSRQQVAAATTTVSGSFKKLGASLSGLAGGRRGSGGVGDGDAAAEHTPQFVQESGDSWRPPAATAPQPPPAAPTSAAPPAAPAPERPPAAAASPKFTLDDDAEARQP